MIDKKIVCTFSQSERTLDSDTKVIGFIGTGKVYARIEFNDDYFKNCKIIGFICNFDKGKTIELKYDHNSKLIELPFSMFDKPGYKYISMYGVEVENETIITTGLLEQKVGKSNYLKTDNIPDETDMRIIATQLINQYIEQFVKPNFKILQSQIDISKQQLDSTVQEINNKLANGEFIGAQGPIGPKGDTGPQGAIGPKGDTGDAVEDNSITNAKLTNNAVTTVKVANNAITAEKLATSAIDLIIPIGIILEFGLDKNPNTIYPGTTWVRFGEGRTTVGLKDGDADFGTIGRVGGAKTHTLITTEMPNHAHLYQTNVQHSDGQIVSTESLTSAIQVGGRRRYADTTAAVGGGGAHNNLQPYIVVAKWIRTA